MNTSADRIRMRVEVQSGLTIDRLTYFIAKWAPQRDPAERETFQMDLMRLDLMRHQGAALDGHIDISMSEQLHRRMTQPLAHVIMNPPKESGK